MATTNVGTIDVYLISPRTDGWRILTLQRSSTTRCPMAWETVHGRIEAGEEPEQAAVREVREETGLTMVRLYNVCVQPFYLHRTHTVELAVVFAAFVDPARAITLVRASAYSWYSTRKPQSASSVPACRAQSRSRPGGLTVSKRSSERVSAIASWSFMTT